MKAKSVPGLLGVLLAAVSLTGCAAVGWITPVYGQADLTDPECYAAFSDTLASALEEQGETPEDAAAAAAGAVHAISLRADPNPFEAVSPSGVAYGAFLEPRRSGACVLKVYERRKGGLSIENTFTFFARRTLPKCTCDWYL
jgi:hypothetical protein